MCGLPLLEAKTSIQVEKNIVNLNESQKIFIQIRFRKIKCFLTSATEIFTDTVGCIFWIAENFNSMAPIEDNRGFSAKILKNGKYASITAIAYKYTSVAKITYTALICYVHWCKMDNKVLGYATLTLLWILQHKHKHH